MKKQKLKTGYSFKHLQHFTNISSTIFLISLLALILFSPVSMAASETKINEEIDRINEQLDEATVRYESVVSDINVCDERIKELEETREELDLQISESSKLVDKRIADVYKYGPISLFEGLLGSKTVSDLTQQLFLMERITLNDIELFNDITASRNELDKNLNLLEEERDGRNQLLAELSAQKIEIQNSLQDRKAVLAEIEAEAASDDVESAASAQPAPELTRSEEGIATWYEFTGAMTAAHNGLPHGTMVRVTNLGNGRQVWVEIVDHGIHGSAIIDLERVAFAQLSDPSDGICQVRVEW